MAAEAGHEEPKPRTDDNENNEEDPKPRIDNSENNEEEPNSEKKSKYKLSQKKRRTLRRTGVLLFRVCCLSLLVAVYAISGALVLHFVERPAEETRVLDAERLNATVRAWVLEVLENHTQLSNASSRMSIVEQIVANVSRATVLGAFEVRRSSNWDFGQSLFFAVTAITTIGYGNVLLRTESGRIFIVFFALFGIPLSILLIATLGQLLSRIFKSFLIKPFRKNLLVLVLVYVCLLLVGFVVIVLLPAVVFWLVETGSGAPDVGPATIDDIPFSSLSSALYYSFITLSTIGFGDIVVLKSDTHPDTPAGTAFYVAFIVVWVYVGLAYLSLVIHEIIIAFSAVWKRIVVKVPWCGMEVAEERFEESALEKLVVKIRNMPGRMRSWTQRGNSTDPSDITMTSFTATD